MRTIGLIGGMSFESSAIYYRLINDMVRARLGGFSSAEIIMHSVNFAPIVALQKQSDWHEAGNRLGAVAAGLERAGAACILICTNTMHLVADAVAARTAVPLIHIIDETAAVLQQQGYRRPLLLATRYTMEHGFYAARMATHGIDVMVPAADERTLVHDVIFNELVAGVVMPASRDRMVAIIAAASAAGADCIILGCTEICLLLDPDKLPLPGFDSTAIHAAAAVDFALSSR